ncbi:hypothetical protein DENSPDRAFT_661466 [Dentipellis sp. KUC8613]|nr:hypothetical protein DENSPDRAFT_661466 [Dentipellis sp. KUC8613]
MRGLPLELADAICEDLRLAAPGDLRNLREANKWWHDVTTPQLFRTLCVTSTLSSATNATNILLTPALARYIREFEFRDATADSDGNPTKQARIQDAKGRDPDIPEDAIGALIAVFALLSHAQALSSIKLVFSPLYRETGHPDEPPSPQFRAQNAIIRILSRILPIFPLRSLRIIHVLAETHPSFSNLLKITASLRTFHMDVLSQDYYQEMWPDPSWEGFWDTCMPRYLLPPASPDSPLENLTIRGQDTIGIHPRFSLAQRTYPRLSSLSLASILFDASVGTEAFIVRHAPTLRRLELERCRIPLDLDEVPADHWAAIWGRLQEVLTNVEELVVHEYNGYGEPIPGLTSKPRSWPRTSRPCEHGWMR